MKTEIDIEFLAEKIFSEVNKYVNRYMADMRKYVDGQIAAVKTHQPDDALIAQTREYVRREIEEAEARIQNKPANADAVALGELPGTVKNLERRATRHADHLLGLEKRVRALEQENEK